MKFVFVKIGPLTDSKLAKQKIDKEEKYTNKCMRKWQKEGN